MLHSENYYWYTTISGRKIFINNIMLFYFSFDNRHLLDLTKNLVIAKPVLSSWSQNVHIYVDASICERPHDKINQILNRIVLEFCHPQEATMLLAIDK